MQWFSVVLQIYCAIATNLITFIFSGLWVFQVCQLSISCQKQASQIPVLWAVLQKFRLPDACSTPFTLFVQKISSFCFLQISVSFVASYLPHFRPSVSWAYCLLTPLFLVAYSIQTKWILLVFQVSRPSGNPTKSCSVGHILNLELPHPLPTLSLATPWRGAQLSSFGSGNRK